MPAMASTAQTADGKHGVAAHGQLPHTGLAGLDSGMEGLGESKPTAGGGVVGAAESCTDVKMYTSWRGLNAETAVCFQKQRIAPGWHGGRTARAQCHLRSVRSR